MRPLALVTDARGHAVLKAETEDAISHNLIRRPSSCSLFAHLDGRKVLRRDAQNSHVALRIDTNNLRNVLTTISRDTHGHFARAIDDVGVRQVRCRRHLR